MKYQHQKTLTPSEIKHHLLQSQISGPGNQPSAILTPNKVDPLHQTSWNVQWHLYSESTRANFLAQIPKWIGFYTSGHTKKPTLWLREMKQLLKEVDILSDICQANRIDGVITFAPAHHLYGLLLSFLLPAVKGLPVWFCPMNSLTSLRYPELKNPLFVTIPSALAYLERRVQDLAEYDAITIIHSTALLPTVGLRLLEKLKHKQVHFVELFGSTETGLIAVRTPKAEVETPWKLVRDVTFANVHPREEGPLEICSPRLASNSLGVRLTSWQLDDFVKTLSLKTFSFQGRRSRLVKINGRRVNLDYMEEVVRQAIPCRDLACVPVRDNLRSENFDLLLVPDPKEPIGVQQTRSKCKEVLAETEQPRRVLLVPELERSSTGKLRWQGRLSA
jgi:acyl-coenzyme A synthetase/AMP-(fatty) acid ligase